METFNYIVGGVAIAAIALFLYIFAFVFLPSDPESTNKGRPYDKFIMDTCSPKGDAAFFQTVFTFGYLKRTTKKFFQYYRLKLFPQPQASVGRPCPDATLVTLEGKIKSLIDDYVKKEPNMPLILNMGSYT
jgi:hypothetical protein